MKNVHIVPVIVAALLGALLGTVLMRLLFPAHAEPAAAQDYVQHLNLPGRDDQLPFSNAVRVDGTVYLAGTIGLVPGTRDVPDTAKEEARLVMESMKSAVEAAGLTMDDLVFVQVFCSDVKHYDEFNAVYRTYFRGNFPARAFIGSGPLLFGARFEVQAIAARAPAARLRPAGD
jgi:2-iminobutanoate/2-iminopropanoate deaminase